LIFAAGGNAERMRIASDGNIGIGTTAPSQRLHVAGRALVDQFQYTKAINYSSGDLDSLTLAGFYDGSGMTNAPNSGWFYVTVEKHSDGSTSWVHQTATSFGAGNTPNEVYTRVRVGSTWGAWKQLGDAASISGTTNYISKFTSANSIGNSLIYDNGTNVGIGTTSPGYKLQVNGDTAFFSTSGNPLSVITQGSEGKGRLYLYDGGSATIGLQTNGASYFNGGNVGIGTTSPTEKLHVRNGNLLLDSDPGTSPGIWMPDINGNPSLRIVTDQTDASYTSIINGWGSSANSGVTLGTTRGDGTAFQVRSEVTLSSGFATDSGTTRFIVLGNGNVGIGTTNPGVKLDVVGDIRLPENNYLYFGNTSNFIRRDSSNILTVAGFSSVHLATFGSTRVAVAGSGDVGIGTTSPDVKLHVVGTSFVPTTMKLVHSQAFGSPQTLSLSSNSTGVSSLDLSFANPFAINIGGSEMMRIAANGSVGVGTTAPDTSSIMDLSSRRQGFLPPRMTNSEMNSIGSPATGLIVYDTTNNKVTVYNGSTWVPLH
jgi:hypothetical protein